MYIDRAEIIAVLRASGLHDRAGWVEREMPDLVDVQKNSTLLKMLGIDPAAMSPAEAGPERYVNAPIHHAAQQEGRASW